MQQFLAGLWESLRSLLTAPWLAPLLTATAITIALFRESFLVWWRRPKLVIGEELRRDKFPYETPSGQVAYYGYNFRLVVGNEGKTTAEKVEVYAARLTKATSGKFVDVPFFPMNLKWAHD